MFPGRWPRSRQGSLNLGCREVLPARCELRLSKRLGRPFLPKPGPTLSYNCSILSVYLSTEWHNWLVSLSYHLPDPTQSYGPRMASIFSPVQHKAVPSFCFVFADPCVGYSGRVKPAAATELKFHCRRGVSISQAKLFVCSDCVPFVFHGYKPSLYNNQNAMESLEIFFYFILKNMYMSLNLSILQITVKHFYPAKHTYNCWWKPFFICLILWQCYSWQSINSRKLTQVKEHDNCISTTI